MNRSAPWWLLIFLLMLAVPAQAWKIVDYRGMAYVDFKEAGEFFNFDVVDLDGENIVLKKWLEPGVNPKTLNEKKNPPDVEWRATAGSKLVSLNRLKFYLSYPVVKQGKTLLLPAFDLIHVIDPILKPDKRREATQLRMVVIDAARGGKEGGLKTKYGTEKVITLDIARKMKTILEGQGLKVFLTRDSDTDMTAEERTALANSRKEEAVFISIHVGYGSEDDRGVETFTMAPSGTPATIGEEGRPVDEKFYPGNINDRESMALATAVQGGMISELKTKDLGIRRARFEELRSIGMPAVLCRVGKLANTVEGPKLALSDYRNEVATALAGGIVRFAAVMARGVDSAERVLAFRKVTTDPEKLNSPTGELVRVRAEIEKVGKVAINPAKVAIQVYFLDFVNGVELDLSACDTPKANWVSVLPSWNGTDVEVVEFVYKQPPYDAALVKTLGRRTYYGFVLRLIYDGQLMEEYAEPANVKRGLSTFTAVLPKR